MLCRCLERSRILALIPTVHPTWWNVNSVFDRFHWFGRWGRLKLLNNGNLLIASFVHTQKSKAAKRVLSVHPRSVNAIRPTERLTRTKGKVGLGQGNGNSEKNAE